MKLLLKIAGVLCLGLAFVGIILPILPTAPFVLLAALCFAKSSDRVLQWLSDHRLFGPMIANWQATRSIPRKAKLMALGSLLFSGSLSVYFLPTLPLKLAVIAILLIPMWIILRLPSTESLIPAEE